MPFAFAGFAFALRLMRCALFGRKMRRRSDPLLNEPLVLNLLLMLDHPLFLFAL